MTLKGCAARTCAVCAATRLNTEAEPPPVVFSVAEKGGICLPWMNGWPYSHSQFQDKNDIRAGVRVLAESRRLILRLA